MTFAFPAAEDEGLPGWVAVLRFVKRDGAVDLGSLEVGYFATTVDGSKTPNRLFLDWFVMKAQEPPPDCPPGGLTIRRLRGIRIGDLQTEARRWLTNEAASDREFERWVGEAHRRPGRAGKEDLHYARLAAAYVRVIRTSPTPNVDLVAETEGVASVNTIRNQLQEARRRDLLTRPGKGLIGGELTEKAKDLLREAGLLETGDITDGEH